MFVLWGRFQLIRTDWSMENPFKSRFNDAIGSKPLSFVTETSK